VLCWAESGTFKYFLNQQKWMSNLYMIHFSTHHINVTHGANYTSWQVFQHLVQMLMLQCSKLQLHVHLSSAFLNLICSTSVQKMFVNTENYNLFPKSFKLLYSESHKQSTNISTLQRI
jgi:hypothetical protein